MSLLRWLLAVTMVGIAGHHLGRLAVAHHRGAHAEADLDLTHAAMGGVMVLVLLGSLSRGSENALALGFVGPALWFLLRATLGYVRNGTRSVGHPLQQALVCCAMVLMLSYASPMAGMETSAAGPDRALLLVVAAAVVAVSGSRRVPAAGSVAPRTTLGCQLAMNATTVTMLLIMA